MPSWQIRHYRQSDVPALVNLINETDRVDDAGLATTLSALAHRFARPDVGAGQNIYVAEVDGRLIGYVMAYLRTEERLYRFGTSGIVHPAWRRQGVGTALMKRAEEPARSSAVRHTKPVALDLYARERVPGAAELALSLGMKPVRYFLYMECQDLQHLPDPALPAGLSLRNYAVGQDAEAFVRAYSDGFADHWGFVPYTVEMERQRISSPGFRPEDTLLAVDRNGAIAGLCILAMPEPGGSNLQQRPPFIDDLAVPRCYRRQGIGRALLLAAMHRVRDLGFAAVGLEVDADNPNRAYRLYEENGFLTQRRRVIYRKLL